MAGRELGEGREGRDFDLFRFSTYIYAIASPEQQAAPLKFSMQRLSRLQLLSTEQTNVIAARQGAPPSPPFSLCHSPYPMSAVRARLGPHLSAHGTRCFVQTFISLLRLLLLTTSSVHSPVYRWNRCEERNFLRRQVLSLG